MARTVLGKYYFLYCYF